MNSRGLKLSRVFQAEHAIPFILFLGGYSLWTFSKAVVIATSHVQKGGVSEDRERITSFVVRLLNTSRNLF